MGGGSGGVRGIGWVLAAVGGDAVCVCLWGGGFQILWWPNLVAHPLKHLINPVCSEFLDFANSWRQCPCFDSQTPKSSTQVVLFVSSIILIYLPSPLSHATHTVQALLVEDRGQATPGAYLRDEKDYQGQVSQSSEDG